MKKKLSFVCKGAKFGSQKRGEQRAFIIPVGKILEFLKKFGESDVKVTAESI